MMCVCSHGRDILSQGGLVAYFFRCSGLALSHPHKVTLSTHSWLRNELHVVREVIELERKWHHAVNTWGLAAWGHEMRPKEWISCLVHETWHIYSLACVWEKLVLACVQGRIHVFKNITKTKLHNFKWILGNTSF